MGIQFGKQFGSFSKSTELSQNPAISFLGYLTKKKEIICLHKHMFIAALYIIVPPSPKKTTWNNQSIISRQWNTIIYVTDEPQKIMQVNKLDARNHKIPRMPGVHKRQTYTQIQSRLMVAQGWEQKLPINGHERS